VWKTDVIEEAREVDLAKERDENWSFDKKPHVDVAEGVPQALEQHTILEDDPQSMVR